MFPNFPFQTQATSNRVPGNPETRTLDPNPGYRSGVIVHGYQKSIDINGEAVLGTIQQTLIQDYQVRYFKSGVTKGQNGAPDMPFVSMFGKAQGRSFGVTLYAEPQTLSYIQQNLMSVDPTTGRQKGYGALITVTGEWRASQNARINQRTGQAYQDYFLIANELLNVKPGQVTNAGPFVPGPTVPQPGAFAQPVAAQPTHTVAQTQQPAVPPATTEQTATGQAPESPF